MKFHFLIGSLSTVLIRVHSFRVVSITSTSSPFLTDKVPSSRAVKAAIVIHREALMGWRQECKQGKKDRKQKTFGWWYSNYQLVKRWMDYNKIKILKWNYLSCLVTLNVHAATTHTYPTHAQTYLLCTCTHAQPYKLQCVLTLESGLAEASSLISGREEKERGWYQVSGLDLAPICRLFLTLRNRNSGIARPLYAS